MSEWIELTSRKDEFTKIVKLLVEFDERTGRYRRYGCESSHWLRKALAVSDQECIRILLRNLGGFVYSVVVEIRTDSGFATMSWLHDDGIRKERDEKKSEANHPVHSIVCVTDLFNEGTGADLTGINPETSVLLETGSESCHS